MTPHSTNRPRPHRRIWSAFALAGWIIVASVGCATSESTATADSEADQVADRQRLGQMIDVCTLERLKLERSRRELRPRYTDMIQLLLMQARGREGDPAVRSRFPDWNPADIEHLEVSYGPAGLRISGRADTIEQIAALIASAEGVFRTPRFDIAQMSRAGSEAIEFLLAEPHVLDDALHGVQLGSDAYSRRPPGQSLAEYAAQTCDFDPEDPRLSTAPAGWEIEPLAARSDGFWDRSTLRASFDGLIHEASAGPLQLVDAASAYEAVRMGHNNGRLVVEFIGQRPADDFDPAQRLQRLGVDDLGALEPPEIDELITWKTHDDGYPVDAPRSLLDGSLRYTFGRTAQAYVRLASSHAQVMSAQALLEHTGRAMRATLCTLRAYSAGYQRDGSEKSRVLEAAGVRFQVPVDGVVDLAQLEHFGVDAHGQARWEFAAARDADLGPISAALGACASGPDFDLAVPATEDGRRLVASSTLENAGLVHIAPADVDPPRFEDGAAFVEAVNASYAEMERRFGQQATALLDGSPAQDLLADGASTTGLAAEIAAAAERFELDRMGFQRRAVDAGAWRHLRPLRLEVTASGTPAQVLGFAAHILDVEGAIVPAEATIAGAADTPGLLRLQASLYAFGPLTAQQRPVP